MKEWTAAFFNDQHRSVMCYLAGLRFKGIDKFDKNNPNYSFKDIKDIDDILTDLKAGKLVQI
jgi:hypothetical protein